MVHRIPFLKSTVFALVIKCDGCKAIKEVDSVFLYRYEAEKRITQFAPSLATGESLEIVTCPLK